MCEQCRRVNAFLHQLTYFHYSGLSLVPKKKLGSLGSLGSTKSKFALKFRTTSVALSELLLQCPILLHPKQTGLESTLLLRMTGVTIRGSTFESNIAKNCEFTIKHNKELRNWAIRSQILLYPSLPPPNTAAETVGCRL